MCRREGMLSRGTQTGLRGGPMWTSWSSIRPSAMSCTWVRAIPNTSTGWAESGLRAALRRRTWGWWLMRSSTWPSNVHSQPRRATVSWAAAKAVWTAWWGRWFCPSTPLWSDSAGSPASSSGALSTGQTWSCWNGFRGGHSNDLRAGIPLLWGKAERVDTVQPGEEKAAGRPYCSISVLKGGL